MEWVFGCRRDSFITHRAFCDALAEESAKNHTQSKKLYPETVTRKNTEPDQKSPPGIDSPPPPPPQPHSPPLVAPAPAPAISVETEPAKITSSSVLPIQSSPGITNSLLDGKIWHFWIKFCRHTNNFSILASLTETRTTPRKSNILVGELGV